MFFVLGWRAAILQRVQFTSPWHKWVDRLLEYAKLRTVEFGVSLLWRARLQPSTLENTQKTIKSTLLAFMRGGKHHLDLIENSDYFVTKLGSIHSRVMVKAPLKTPVLFQFIRRSDRRLWFFRDRSAAQPFKNERFRLRGPRNGYQADGSIRYGFQDTSAWS